MVSALDCPISVKGRDLFIHNKTTGVHNMITGPTRRTTLAIYSIVIKAYLHTLEIDIKKLINKFW